MRPMIFQTVLTLLLLQGCGTGSNDDRKDSQASGSPAASVAGERCAILAPDQVQALFATPLTETPADSLPQSQSCEFAEAGGNVAVTVTKVPARYYEEHRGKEFRKLPGIGEDASILWELDGWRATARSGDNAIIVMTDGPVATQENTIAILTAALPKS